MTRKEITSIALKVFSLYILANILFTLPTSFFMLDMIVRPFTKMGKDIAHMPKFWLGGLSIFLILIGIIVALMLWKLSDSLARKAGDDKYPHESSLSADSLEPIILSAVGAFIALNSFSHLGRLVNRLLNIALLSKPETGIQISDILNITFELIVIGLGVSLIIKSNWWIKLFKKYR